MMTEKELVEEMNREKHRTPVSGFAAWQGDGYAWGIRAQGFADTAFSLKP